MIILSNLCVKAKKDINIYIQRKIYPVVGKLAEDIEKQHSFVPRDFSVTNIATVRENCLGFLAATAENRVAPENEVVN